MFHLVLAFGAAEKACQYGYEGFCFLCCCTVVEIHCLVHLAEGKWGELGSSGKKANGGGWMSRLHLTGAALFP